MTILNHGNLVYITIEITVKVWLTVRTFIALISWRVSSLYLLYSDFSVLYSSWVWMISCKIMNQNWSCQNYFISTGRISQLYIITINSIHCFTSSQTVLQKRNSLMSERRWGRSVVSHPGWAVPSVKLQLSVAFHSEKISIFFALRLSTTFT